MKVSPGDHINIDFKLTMEVVAEHEVNATEVLQLAIKGVQEVLSVNFPMKPTTIKGFQFFAEEIPTSNPGKPVEYGEFDV